MASTHSMYIVPDFAARLGTLQDWDKTRATRILKLNSPCGCLSLELTMSHAPTTDIEANKITQMEETVAIDIWCSLRYLGVSIGLK